MCFNLVALKKSELWRNGRLQDRPFMFQAIWSSQLDMFTIFSHVICLTATISYDQIITIGTEMRHTVCVTFTQANYHGDRKTLFPRL